ncbi:P-loop NTPase family protein [Methylomonas rhizoryzae]|uniref:hypothetical protein n=1 Tax=Methylomonas rhizoryzae TaxID=2608981 RepID=UPI001231B360|nr:hypothetical protein [Methylomonas rhizoryzae]
MSQWLQAFNAARPAQPAFKPDDLRQHLQRDAAWLSRERDALQQLEQALMQAQTVLAERRWQCEQHLQTRRSLESGETLASQLADLSERLNSLTQRLGDLQMQRRLDDERLQALGRKVGVISHVQEMTERIGIGIEVKRVGSGLSRIKVIGPAASPN